MASVTGESIQAGGFARLTLQFESGQSARSTPPSSLAENQYSEIAPAIPSARRLPDPAAHERTEPHPDPAPPRRERVERHATCSRAGWTSRSATRAATKQPAAASCSSRRPAPDVRAHLAAPAGDHHGEPRPGRGRPSLDPGPARWRLNERHYGALQGKDKKQTLEQYGEEQFMLWRRSFDVPAAGDRGRRRVFAGRRPALRRLGADDAAHRVPQGRDRAARCPTGTARSCPTCAAGQRSWSPPTATACARWSSTSTASATRTSPALNIPTGMPLVYDSTQT